MISHRCLTERIFPRKTNDSSKPPGEYALQSAPVTPSFTRHSHPRAINLRAILEKLGAVSSNYRASDRRIAQNTPARVRPLEVGAVDRNPFLHYPACADQTASGLNDPYLFWWLAWLDLFYFVNVTANRNFFLFSSLIVGARVEILMS
ncbi:hypothetical protein V3481_000709 [Fusarium oxysporum f. sp. vasinfectum]